MNPSPKTQPWPGTLPTHCDICLAPFLSTFILARTLASGGAFLLLCRECHKEFGLGFGEGIGEGFDLFTGEALDLHN